MKKITKKLAKKIVKNHNRKVSRDNAYFETLKPAEKRVAIARDVLAQIALKRFKPVSGFWITTPGNKGDIFNEKDVKKDPELQSIFQKTKQCDGCAIGGMFMCAVERSDKLKLSELECVKSFKEQVKYHDSHPNDVSPKLREEISEEDAFDYLGKFFSKDQLEMIEVAFEQGGGAISKFDCNTEALQFVEKVEEPADRMKLIMQNIVVNKGKFCPDKKPVQVWATPGFLG